MLFLTSVTSLSGKSETFCPKNVEILSKHRGVPGSKSLGWPAKPKLASFYKVYTESSKYSKNIGVAAAPL